jgi:hypothetical protein
MRRLERTRNIRQGATVLYKEVFDQCSFGERPLERAPAASHGVKALYFTFFKRPLLPAANRRSQSAAPRRMLWQNGGRSRGVNSRGVNLTDFSSHSRGWPTVRPHLVAPFPRPQSQSVSLCRSEYRTTSTWTCRTAPASRRQCLLANLWLTPPTSAPCRNARKRMVGSDPIRGCNAGRSDSLSGSRSSVVSQAGGRPGDKFFPAHSDLPL